MSLGPPPPAPRRSWKSWIACLAFLVVCGAFLGIRQWAERKRQLSQIQWDTDKELRQKVARLVDLSLDDVRDQLCPGKTLPGKTVWGVHGFDVSFPGSLIGARYDGWRVNLRFGGNSYYYFLRRHRPDTEDGVEIMRTWDITSPPTLGREIVPQDWWAVERARAMGLRLAVVAWTGGLILIVLVRRARRDIAPFCLAAGVACMLAAALDLNFNKETIWRPWSRDAQTLLTTDTKEIRWKKTIADHPAWFDGGAGMAAIALLLWVIPIKQISARQCHTCCYDLTGNESGICPECGTPTIKERRRQRLAEMEPVADQLVKVMVTVSEDEGEGKDDRNAGTDCGPSETISAKAQSDGGTGACAFGDHGDLKSESIVPSK